MMLPDGAGRLAASLVLIHSTPNAPVPFLSGGSEEEQV